MTKRMNIALEDDAAEMLLRLAGSPRKQGDFLSNLIRTAAHTALPVANASMSDLATQIAQLQARLTELEDRLEEPGLIRLYDEAKAEGGTPIPFEQMLAEVGYRG